jgi:hypothetical protein
LLREIFRPTRNAVTGGWEILHNEVPHQITRHCIPEDLNFYLNPSLFELPESIIRMTKLKRTKWSEIVTGMGDDRNTYGVLGEKMKEKNNLEDLGVDGSVILKWTIQY